jgi:hypothetical protein
MPKAKKGGKPDYCRVCHVMHPPPTGRNCNIRLLELNVNPELDVSGSSVLQGTASISDALPASSGPPGVRSGSLFEATGSISGAPPASASLSSTRVMSGFHQGTASISGVLPTSGSVPFPGPSTTSEIAQHTAVMTSLVSRLDATVSRLDATQGQVSELSSIFRDSSSGVHDSSAQSILPVCRDAQAAAAVSTPAIDSMLPMLAHLESSRPIVAADKQSGGASNTNRPDKKTVRICKHFNNHKCRFDSNHQCGDVCWLHVCAKCKKAGHIDSDCNFLEKLMLS